MNFLQKVIELDFAYLDSFTNRIDTSWGCIFYNEEQPSYYDANHAHLHQTPDDPKLVIKEVVSFYQKRNLIPRFYLYDYAQHAQFIEELEKYGFKVEALVGPVQLWNRKISVQRSNRRVSIEKVTDENFREALEIECSIKEFGGRAVREKSFPEEFKHPAFTHYLLRFDGVACATACIFEDEGQAQMESVATLEEFRGQGLIGYLIQHIQLEVQKRGLENLWVFPISERVGKVYQRSGFDTIGEIKTGHAFLGGKGIKEIQNR